MEQKNTSNDNYNYRNPSSEINLVLDNCPEVWGNSTSTIALVEGSYVVVAYYGCQDTDGDGREDSTDAFPTDPTQVADSDGDGWGDNQGGNNPDACPFDAGVIDGTKPDGTPSIGCPIPSDDPDDDQDGVPMIAMIVQIPKKGKLSTKSAVRSMKSMMTLTRFSTLMTNVRELRLNRCR